VSSGLVRRRETFSRDDRLRKRREFEECYAGGVRVSGRHLQLFLLPPGALPRLGISVPRRVGEAVTRNLLRRRVREIFRRNRSLFGTAGGNLVVNVRPSAAGVTFAELAEDYRSSLTKLFATLSRPSKRPAR
jgi:ribonuclease P protein component